MKISLHGIPISRTLQKDYSLISEGAEVGIDA
jgi:hypothetical protein